MHPNWKYCALLAIFLANPLEISARAIDRRDLAALLPRIEIPGITIPKPIPIPKPVVPEVPGNVPGRIPPIKPEPVPVPKPEPKPGNQPCKRVDGCVPKGPLDPPDFVVAHVVQKFGDDGLTVNGFIPWETKATEMTKSTEDTAKFDANLRSVTQRLYDELPLKTKAGGNNIVSSIWVPQKGIYFSSIPRQQAAAKILSDKANAPSWDWQAGAGRNNEKDLHAEDGAIYNFEILNPADFADPAKARAWKFPTESRIAVYGKPNGDMDEGFLYPCRNTIKAGGYVRDPTCDTVVNRMGLTPVSSPAHNPK
ncbi:hypothetical protein PEBR_23391 [Penicillium brasilianum]|uniref:Uncharacterized protein n=1 Tax=Penicillium brasilianum TaxID=104259 RepID=A0A1S9RKD3_PENBI|nr:hypothetical protein PEBR_23391 [Penicillium brasilianum]